MWMAANFIMEGCMWLYGPRLCTIALGIHLPIWRVRLKLVIEEKNILEVDRYGFLEADTDISADTNISAIHGLIPITDISKIFKSCFLLRYQKRDVFYAIPFFENLKNQDLWAKIFEIAAISMFGNLLS